MLTIIAIKSRLFMCLRYEKVIKSTNSLIRYINICKISITLLDYQSLNKPE